MNINCDVIGDLLPLYAENMLSQSSRTMVDEHLASCESCRDKLAHMRELVPIPTEEKREKLEEAAPLKKFRWVLLGAILGFPVWFPLAVAAVVIALALYICVWAVVVSLWCVPISLGAWALTALVTSAVKLMSGAVGAALFYGGCGIACIGVAMLLFLLVKALTVGVGKGTARAFRRIRRKRNV